MVQAGQLQRGCALCARFTLTGVVIPSYDCRMDNLLNQCLRLCIAGACIQKQGRKLYIQTRAPKLRFEALTVLRSVLHNFSALIIIQRFGCATGCSKRKQRQAPLIGTWGRTEQAVYVQNPCLKCVWCMCPLRELRCCCCVMSRSACADDI